jgi:hypothetical protein
MDYESEDCECDASQASVIKMIAVG